MNRLPEESKELCRIESGYVRLDANIDFTPEDRDWICHWELLAWRVDVFYARSGGNEDHPCGKLKEVLTYEPTDSAEYCCTADLPSGFQSKTIVPNRRTSTFAGEELEPWSFLHGYAENSDSWARLAADPDER